MDSCFFENTTQLKSVLLKLLTVFTDFDSPRPVDGSRDAGFCGITPDTKTPRVMSVSILLRDSVAIPFLGQINPKRELRDRCIRLRQSNTHRKIVPLFLVTLS